MTDHGRTRPTLGLGAKSLGLARVATTESRPLVRE